MPLAGLDHVASAEEDHFRYLSFYSGLSSTFFALFFASHLETWTPAFRIFYSKLTGSCKKFAQNPLFGALKQLGVRFKVPNEY
jgi:hypothetical protein